MRGLTGMQGLTLMVIIGVTLLAGICFGVQLESSAVQGKRLKKLRPDRERPNILRSVTRFLFITTQIFALVWVSASYGIAAYSTVKLFQPFPVEELSRQAIITLLGMSGLKVVENIFEHNEGMVFGQSKTEDDPPDEGGEEGGMG